MLSYLDEKAFIMIAFFICVYCIIKFAGPKILSMLDKKKNNITLDIDEIENNLNNTKKELEKNLEEEKNSANFATNMLKNMNEERIKTIQDYNASIDDLLKKKILKQKEINHRLENEINNEFNKISWNASINLLKNQFDIDSGINKNDIHRKLIQKIIKD